MRNSPLVCPSHSPLTYDPVMQRSLRVKFVQQMIAFHSPGKTSVLTS